MPKPEGFTYADPAATLNAFAPKSEMFGQDALGLVAIRTGWGPGHTAITYKAGDYLAHHGHFDQGTFTIFKNAPLVVNMGGYGYYADTHRLNYYVRTVGKNSILVMRPGEAFPHDGVGTSPTTAASGSSTPPARPSPASTTGWPTRPPASTTTWPTSTSTSTSTASTPTSTAT